MSFLLKWWEIPLLFSKNKKEIYAKCAKVTSAKVASKASKVLKDKRTSANTKSVAGSELSQREKKKK